MKSINQSHYTGEQVTMIIERLKSSQKIVEDKDASISSIVPQSARINSSDMNAQFDFTMEDQQIQLRNGSAVHSSAVQSSVQS